MSRTQMKKLKKAEIRQTFFVNLSKCVLIGVCMIALWRPICSLHATETATRVTASVHPTEIFDGESTILTISVDNVSDDVSVDVRSLETDFSVEDLGSTKRSSIRTDFSSARQIKKESIDFKFRITPKARENTTIPELVVNAGGQTFSSNPVVVKIKEQSTTDLLFIETSVLPGAEIYPLLPLEVSVDVFVKECPGKYQNYDPLALVVENLGAPQLTIPWLEDGAIEKQTVWERKASEWLSSLRSSRHGFKLNSYSSSPFGLGGISLFFDSSVDLFLPKPEKTTRKDAQGNDVSFWKYSFKRKLRATNSTTLHFESSTIKGQFIDFSDPNEPRPQDVYLKSNAVDVVIKEIPEQDAPNDYVGVFGKLKLNATLSDASLSVGDVTTLSLTLQGYGSFDNARAPRLQDLPQFSETFKTYPPIEESLSDGVVYNYQIRPTKDGTLVIPAIVASFFNVETGQFERLQTDPFKLQVHKGLFHDQDEQNGYSNPTVDAKESSSKAKLLNKRRLVVGCALLFTIALTILITLGTKCLLVKRAEAIAFSNRHIVETARRELEQGLNNYSISPENSVQAIRLAFLRLVAQKFDQNLDSITDTEFEGFLECEFQDDGALNVIAKMKDFLKVTERLRFAADKNVNPQFAQDVARLFDEWVECLTTKVKRLATISLEERKR